MERVVKGFTGYSKEKEGKPATHVILTVDEYEELQDRIKELHRDAENTRLEANRQIMGYKKQSDDIVAKEKENAQNEVYAIQCDLNTANREIDRLNNLNANLLRISRERANSKRGLKPKKVHHGYMVLDSQQNNYNHRWYNGRKSVVDSFACWKVRIQSPYDCSIPFRIITKNIQEDLLNVFGSSLGITSIFKGLEEKSIKDIEALWNNGDNFIFKTNYKSNYKAGLWEVEYWVRASITVPEDMRAI
jgi:tetrahydromethanopterin S-methyltransferase subunit G